MFLKKYIPNSALFKNSFWGLAGSIVQNIFLSLFYLLVARHYAVEDFAQYIIASNLYQMIVAFSAMGLGQWYIREMANTENKNELSQKFLKIQAYFGVFFFFISILLALLLYDDYTIQVLSLLFAANIIFDNIIYAIKHVNIAEFAQKKTVSVLSIEAISKFVIACLLFVYPFSIITLSIILVGIRFLTLNLFLKIGAADGIQLQGFWKTKVSFDFVKTILKKYWPFAVIGSAYIIYWKISTLIISKTLPLIDVNHYENSFKVFSLAQLIPIVLSATVLPKFVELQKKKDFAELKKLYKKIFQFCLLYGIGAFTFMHSFADDILPLLFGSKYLDTSSYTKEMFLTMLILPTAMLQAQILITMKLEKLDMWFNINSVIINTTLCLIGLYFIKSLSIVNYAIFTSYIIFHLSQDYALFKRKFISAKEIFSFFLIVTLAVLSYIWLSPISNQYLLFFCFWLIFLPIFFAKKIISKRSLQN